MANRNLFPVKRLSPSNAFLSAAEGHLSLCICFRPFVWDGETTETSLNIDLYNVLPSPYPRDLAGLQRTSAKLKTVLPTKARPSPNVLWTAACIWAANTIPLSSEACPSSPTATEPR